MASKNLNTMPATVKDGLPIAKRSQYMKAMCRGDYHKVAQAIIQVLDHFDQTPYVDYAGSDVARINEFVLIVFMVMTDPKFKPTKQDLLLLVSYSHIFTHLVAASVYESTNPVLLQILNEKGDNFERALFNCNPRCGLNINQKPFFDIEPNLASVWFNSFIQTNSNCTNRSQVNLMRHYESMDPRWVPPYADVSVPYFTVSYFAPESVRSVKAIMNTAIGERMNADIKNNPNPKSIAIVTAKWHRNHAVYKSAAPLINQLKGHYKLTLVHLGEKAPRDLMTEGFDTVCSAHFKDTSLVLPPSVMDNDFQMVYFPDIGMNAESIWMANTRIAPIQAMGYGHPDTSGDGSCIDYFVGGHCEKDCKDSYSEQMVLIPGLAQEPAWPSYERKHNWVDSKPVKINCVWGPDKYNSCMLRGLEEISRRATGEHEWHFYPSPAINRYAAFIPFKRNLLRILPNAVIHEDLHYAAYMESAEQGDFTVNSFPFGGYNTVVESFYLGLPVVTLEGDRFYNKAASYLLRKIGMPELTSRDPNEFVSLCVKLIDDDVFRAEYRAKLAALDLKKILFSTSGTYFKDAVDYIIANHPIERGDPILIGDLNE